MEQPERSGDCCGRSGSGGHRETFLHKQRGPTAPHLCWQEACGNRLGRPLSSSGRRKGTAGALFLCYHRACKAKRIHPHDNTREPSSQSTRGLPNCS
nr:hypothetical protein Q903MT_gene4697 [Picea sitchensis]